MGNGNEHIGDDDSGLIHLAELGKPGRTTESNIAGLTDIGRASRVVEAGADFDMSGMGHAERLVRGSGGLVLTKELSAEEYARRAVNLLRSLHEYNPKRRTVLVVDDDPDMGLLQREFIGLIFGKLGVGAEVVDDPILALQRVRGEIGESVIFALIDYDMPGMKGLELGERLRKEPSLGRAPFLVSSGNPGFKYETDDVSRTLKELRERDVFHGFVPKPASKREFARAIWRASDNAVLMARGGVQIY